ncbi:hypothetical protein BDZ89DRAFT_1086833 [Hymenopellis radicata]|nr:hypothetical protein BDZ89DRAFT_1086833 [Hymenopellis radicata]
MTCAYCLACLRNGDALKHELSGPLSCQNASKLIGLSVRLSRRVSLLQMRRLSDRGEPRDLKKPARAKLVSSQALIATTMAIIAFILTIIISVLFLLLVSAWAVVKVYKAKIRNAHEEDEESYIFKSSVWEPTVLLFSQKVAFASPAPTIESPLPPLNPGATHSHPSLPPNITASQDAEVSVPSTALVHSEDCLPSQASSQVNPTAVCAEDSETHAPAVRLQVSTVPIITHTPPTPKKVQAKTAKNIKLSTSASAPLLPLQTLTPNYYRVFTSRVKQTPARLTKRVIDKENFAPPPAASKRKSSRRVRKQQLKEYIPPAYLLAQRCIDIVHSRSARHAAEDELRYGAPQKF